MTPSPATLIVDNAAELVTCRAGADDVIGCIPRGSVAVAGERIMRVGTAPEVRSMVDGTGARVIDATGKVVIPGFVDPHTHVVFAGSRVDEFAARLRGEDDEELARSGVAVGILGTAAETRTATDDRLKAEGSSRLSEMLEAGTTTVESKSGYGLETEAELRSLQVSRWLGHSQPADLVETFLGAHAIPSDRPRAVYIDEIVKETIPKVAEEELAAFCDVYCDDGYFTVVETARILGAGLEHGLKPKLHLDAYSHTGAARLAAELGCTSVDHMNHTGKEELRLLRDAGTIAVLMPALDLAVNHPRPVDARPILEIGMPVALATDMTPACWLTSMQFVIALACRVSHLTVPEAIRAATLNAARALSLDDEIGSIEPGKLADILILDIGRHEDLAYRLGRDAVQVVIKRGTVAIEPP
jgi:imidazolonepropionase